MFKSLNNILIATLLLSSFLYSCKEQDIVTKIEGDLGVLNATFVDDSNFGDIIPEINYEKIITLSNSGHFSISSINIVGPTGSLTFKDGTYPGTGGNCSRSIESEESCTLVLNFYAELQEEFISDFVISYNDGLDGQTQAFPMNAYAATAASLVFSQGDYETGDDVLDHQIIIVSFPRLSIGATATEIVTIYNEGQRDAILPGIPPLITDMTYTDGVYPGTNGTCGLIILAGEVCKISLTHTGVTKEQLTTAVDFEYYNGLADDAKNITFFTDTVDERANIRINGPSLIELDDVPEDYAQRTVINLINDTVIDATAINMTLSNNQGGLSFSGGSYPGTNGTCSDTLTSLTSCALELEFNSDILGAHAEELYIEFNDNHLITPLVVNKSISITTQVVPPAIIDFVPAESIPSTTPEDFGSKAVNSDESHILTFKNNGDFKAELIEVDLVNNPSGAIDIIAGGSCGVTKTSLVPGDKCTVKVRVASIITGAFSADFQLSYDDGKGDGTRNITLTQPITVNYVDVSDLVWVPSTVVNFGDVLTGVTSTSKSVTLYNYGMGTATSLSFDSSNLLSSPYELMSNTCGATLAGNSSCQLEFRVSPIVTGLSVSSIGFTFEDLLGSQTKNVSLRAYSRAPALLELRDRQGTTLTEINFQDAPVGKMSTLAITVYNLPARLIASSASLSITGSHFNITDPTSFTNDYICNPIDNFNINGGYSCRFELSFIPDSASLFDETLTLSYDDGANSITQDYSVIGTGGPSGLLEVIGAERFVRMNLGTSIAMLAETFILTLENTGDLDVTDFGINSLTNYFEIGPTTCFTTIIPGATCTLDVIYDPPTEGRRESYIDYTFNTSNSIKEFRFQISANAIRPPDVYVSFTGPTQPGSHDFGEVPFLVEELLTINIGNIGAADANNLSFTIDQGALSSFSIQSTFCPIGGALPGNSGCQVVLKYSPEDQAIHNATFQINYDGYGNEELPIEITFRGEGVDPLAEFTGWNEIYAATGAATGNIDLKWDAADPTVDEITVDGYKVYFREGTALPSSLDELVAYEVESIIGDTDSDRVYSYSNANPDTIYYFAIRPTYLARVMNNTNETGNLKIIMPPPHMALIHPYSVNKEVCENMEITTESDHKLGCPYEGAGNTNDYYTYNKYLYVDRYELSLDGGSNPQNLPGVAPVVYSSQFLAGNACLNATLNFQGEDISKRLIRRSEFVHAAAWEKSLGFPEIEARESGARSDDCAVDQDMAELTGAKSNCISKYGVYDLVGNVWEWNSDQVNNGIGWFSSIDVDNDEIFGMNIGDLFPAEVSSLPCFNFTYGVVQNFGAEICPNGIQISTNEDLFLNDYYYPPLMTGIKPIRSGGGVGSDGGFYNRKAGRWVGDFNTSMTNNTENTGARCVFTRPFE